MSISLNMYDSTLAAKFLLAIANKKGKILNVTKVQKLLYMAYGYFLAKKGRVIFDEKPKAWPYGPVFPKTRKKINYSEIIDSDSPEFESIKDDTDVVDLFELLVDKYSVYTASQLSEWSHAKNGPWDLATKQKGFDWNHQIPDELITPYFSNLNF